MSDYPDDVVKAAKDCAATVCRNLDYDDITVEVNCIAQAIMSERYRCSAIADNHKIPSADWDDQFDAGFDDAATRISRAINPVQS
jgi:hypothetical protein